MYDRLPPEEREQFDAENRRIVEEFNDPEKRKKIFADLDKKAADIEKSTPMRFEDYKPRRGSNFWSSAEEDEFADVEDADDTFLDDDIPSIAHAELEVHREVREYARITAWDMPMLSSRSARLPAWYCPLTRLQNSHSLSPSLLKLTSSDSVTLHTWVNPIPPNQRSSWNYVPEI